MVNTIELSNERTARVTVARTPGVGSFRTRSQHTTASNAKAEPAVNPFVRVIRRCCCDRCLAAFFYFNYFHLKSPTGVHAVAITISVLIPAQYPPSCLPVMLTRRIPANWLTADAVRDVVRHSVGSSGVETLLCPFQPVHDLWNTRKAVVMLPAATMQRAST
jgi:hypothetical protein